MTFGPSRPRPGGSIAQHGAPPRRLAGAIPLMVRDSTQLGSPQSCRPKKGACGPTHGNMWGHPPTWETWTGWPRQCLSQGHAGPAQEAPDIGQWEGQDVPLVRPSSCNVKGGILSSGRYLPTYLGPETQKQTTSFPPCVQQLTANKHGKTHRKKNTACTPQCTCIFLCELNPAPCLQQASVQSIHHQNLPINLHQETIRAILFAFLGEPPP